MALSEESRRVIDAARVAYGPSELDRARVRGLLVGQLAGMGVASAATKAGATLLGSVGSKIVLLGSVVCIAGAAASAHWAWQKRPSAVVTQQSNPTPIQPLIEQRPAVGAPLEEQGQDRGRDVSLVPSAQNPSPAAQEGRATPTKVSKPPAPDVQGEIALLGRAQKALSSGQATRALELLDEYARAYPKGTLFEERNAAHIIALCKTGQVAQARAEAGAFIRKSPQSPLTERVRSSCGDSLNPAGAAK